MELQLGLALPIDNAIEGYDQIKHGIKAKQLGDCFESRNCTKRKRSFEDQAIAQNENEPSLTLPLLSWNDQPRDEDDRKEPKRTDCCTVKKKDEENNHVVGWPPIKSWRKKAFHRRQQVAQMIENRRRRVADNNEHGGRNSLFVKVKMEGVAIARKLDLKLYHSHQSLKTALLTMFAAYQTSEKDGWNSTLIYEDKEGDWLLAEDLPWNSFVEAVERLKILVRKGKKD